MLSKRFLELLKNKERNYVLISQVVGALIALVTGKLIASYIAPEDFGVYGIQFATFTFFASLLINPTTQFIKANSKEFIALHGIQPYFFLSTLIIVVSFVLIATSFYVFLDVRSNFIYVLTALYIIFNTWNRLIKDAYNIRNLLIKLSNLNMIRASISLIFLFLVFKLTQIANLEVEILWAIQVVGAVGTILIFNSNYKLGNLPISLKVREFIKSYLKYAWPLSLAAFWIWITNYFDRYAIEYFIDTNAVGIYSANYGLGSKFFLFLGPLFVILITPTIFSSLDNYLKKRLIIKYSLVYFIFSIIPLVLLYFFNDLIGQLLLSEEYGEGFYLQFWIALAFFLFTTSQIFELYFYATSRTKPILGANIVAAALNIFLNFLLIPRMGLLGAALATCISYLGYLAFFCMKFYLEMTATVNE